MNYLLIGGPNHGQIVEQKHNNTGAPIRVIINSGIADIKDPSMLGDIHTIMYYPRRIGFFNKTLRTAVCENLSDTHTVDALLIRLILRDRIIDILEK